MVPREEKNVRRKNRNKDKNDEKYFCDSGSMIQRTNKTSQWKQGKEWPLRFKYNLNIYVNRILCRKMSKNGDLSGEKI